MVPEHDSPPAPWRRWFLLGVMAIIIAAITAAIVVKRGSADGAQNDENAVNEASAELLVPNLCALNVLVERKEFPKASRYFWDRIHLNTHLVGSLLLDDHCAEAMNITRAKATVETDMRTLSPNLATSVPKLLATARTGVQTLNLQGSDTPCSGEAPIDVP